MARRVPFKIDKNHVLGDILIAKKPWMRMFSPLVCVGTDGCNQKKEGKDRIDSVEGI